MFFRPALVTCIPVLALALGCPSQKTTEPGAGEGGDKTPAATVNGETVTVGEIDAWIKDQLFANATDDGDPGKLYEIRSKALEDVINERLLAAEAAPLGIDPDELLKQESAKRAVVTEEDVRAFYDENKQRLGDFSFEDVKSRIQSHLQQQRRQNAADEYLAGLRAKATIETYLDAPRVAVEAKGPSLGPDQAPVTIIEFSDYQCPFCRRAASVVKQVLERYPSEVRFVYRNFPLDRIHPHAREAAEAAACAERQGRFWEYHDRLFSADAELDPESLLKYAKDVGLDLDEFQSCVGERRTKAEVEADLADGRAAGVSGTPAFFVNGIPLKGAKPLDDFVELIDKELGRSAG